MLNVIPFSHFSSHRIVTQRPRKIKSASAVPTIQARILRTRLRTGDVRFSPFTHSAGNPGSDVGRSHYQVPFQQHHGVVIDNRIEDALAIVFELPVWDPESFDKSVVAKDML